MTSFEQGGGGAEPRGILLLVWRNDIRLLFRNSSLVYFTRESSIQGYSVTAPDLVFEASGFQR